MSSRGPFGGLRDRLSSFRTRLRLFFVLIVIVPMIAVTLIVFRLIAESENGQADARVAARQEAAISLYYDARANADRLAAQVGRDRSLASALRSGDRARIAKVAQALLTTTHAARIALSTHGRVWADVGDPGASFSATRTLVQDGKPIADLQVSVLGAQDYAQRVKRLTQLEAVVRRGQSIIASTIAAQGVEIPAHSGRVRVGGHDFRTASFTAPGFLGERLQVSVLESEAQTAHDIRNGRLVAGLILAGFFLLALVSALVVSRSLNRQIEDFLAAARRLAGGDFSVEAPTRGRDQFAELGEEFNKMSRELEGRMGELGQERLRLELSLRRIGETFASNLDRDALLEIVVRTAVDAVDAQGGHALLERAQDGVLEPVATAGTAGDADRPAAAFEAERRVLAVAEPALANVEGGHALAHPLRAGPAAGAQADAVTGVISVWRPDRAFSHRERELFHYLAGQAAVSIENVGLHETVERQAVTDELTGLSNRRRFQETLAVEIERSKRFALQLGLVMLDIDDFKAVNDNYGHQQGDTVLREVAKILRASSREIDEPARYGGEELAVVLPGTDLEGAHNLAERVRVGIEALRLPIVGDEGAEPLRITASFGAAALSDATGNSRALVAAADEALYQAKRAGKNRTVSAG